MQAVTAAIRNSLLGVALGDALGAPHELKIKSGPYTGQLIYETTVGNRFHGPVKLPVGSITDDTDMSLVLARRLIEDRTVIPDKLTLDYIEWADRKPTCLGKNTRFLFRSIKTKDVLRTYRTRYAKVDPDNQAIGSLMRASPLMCLPLSTPSEQLESLVISDTLITNKHRTSQLTTVVYINCLRTVLKWIATNGLPSTTDRAMLKSHLLTYIQQVIDSLESDASTYDLRVALVQALTDPIGEGTKRDIATNKGWVLHGLYCAIYGLANFDSYQAAIDTIIRRGGDCDTTAAIAGGLLGLLYPPAESTHPTNIDTVIRANPELSDLDSVSSKLASLFLS